MPAPAQLGPDRELEEAGELAWMRRRTIVTDGANSDAEIRILYLIVQRAILSPDVGIYPWRAVHRAYKQVLGEYGIDENSDSIYLRFLFLLRERQVTQPEYSLDDHFHQLLLENGIELQLVEDSEGGSELELQHGFQEDGQDNEHRDVARAIRDGARDGAGDVTIALERYGRPMGEVATAASQWLPTPSRQRRASLTSLTFGNEGSRPKPAKRRASFSQVEETTGRLSVGNEYQNLAVQQDGPWESSMIANPSSPSAPLLRATGTESQQFQKSARAWSSHDRQPATGEYQRISSRDTGRQLKEAGKTTSKDKEAQAASAQLIRDDLSQRKPSVPNERFPTKTLEMDYGPIHPRMYSVAIAFDVARIQETSRRIIVQWYQQAYNKFNDRQELERRAAQWDKEQLMRDSFKIWSQAVRDIRYFRAQRVAEERRFAILEQRAQDARDTRLLTKAFHHWAACAADETERATLAKQHLVRFRYFQAWREYTVANEFTILRFGLDKWLRRWRKTFSEEQRRGVSVIDYYDDTLLQKTFAQWLLIVRERQLKRRLEKQSLSKTFEKIVARFRVIQENQLTVTRATQRATLQSLHRGHHDHRKQLADAYAFHRQRILHRAFLSIQREQRIAVCGRQVAGLVDYRVASNALRKLKHQFDLEKTASAFDRERILANAWHMWSGRLKEQALTKKINERILAQSLYKWVLAERGRLFERLHTERLVHRCMVKVVDHWSDQSTGLTEAFVQFRKSQKQRNLRSIMELWWQRTRNNTRLEGVAIENYERGLKQTALDTLIVRHERIQMLEEQYLPNAQLWFLGTSALKQWRESTKKARITKRHAAYATVRRNVKQHLARKCLDRWREKSALVIDQRRKALEFESQNLTSLGTDLFFDWRDKSRYVQDQEAHASYVRQTHLVRRPLHQWTSEWARTRENMTVALEHDAEHTKRAAYICLRKLHFRIGSIQDLHASRRVADQIQWSQRRYCRTLLRLWLDKTTQKRGMTEADIPATARTRRFRNLLNQSQLRESSRGGTITASDGITYGMEALALEDTSTTPAIPPPSTPSRRRFAKAARTPAPALRPLAISAREPITTINAPNTESEQSVRREGNPFVEPGIPASESRLRPNRPFGKSAARVLFKPIPERAPDSFS